MTNKTNAPDRGEGILKGRLTSKKLMEWCNWKFEQLDILDFVVTDVERTRFLPKEYENGACKLHIRFCSINDKQAFSSFMCYYSIGELSDYLKNGYRLMIRDRKHHGIISDFELDVVK